MPFSEKPKEIIFKKIKKQIKKINKKNGSPGNLPWGVHRPYVLKGPYEKQ